MAHAKAYIGPTRLEESMMSEAVHDSWEKELRVLLNRVQAHPETGAERDRDRIALLTRLIGSRRMEAA